MTNSPSKFTVHGENYKIEQYIVNPIEINKKFNEDLEEYQKNKKEKKRNTEILSNYKNGKNFNIKVKRVYNKVFLKFDAFTKHGHSFYKTELGYYSPKIKERIKHKDKITIYYPKGFDIRIEVIRGLNSYIISIGDEYTNNFEYYSD